jgi:molecular chaperone DnaJ
LASQREWFEKDYYKILGVTDTATPKELTRAYRKLARELHPDANPDNPAAEERFKEVAAAYDVLGDEAKRKEYDEVRALGPMGAGADFGGGYGGGPGGFGFPGGGQGGAGYSSTDINDLLGGLFGRGGRGAGAGAGGSRGPGPQRGDDLETELHLTFPDAVRGVETSVNLTSEVTCSTCHGSGAKPGTAPVTCPRCAGRGVLDDTQGFFSFSTPCPECAGRGTLISEPCPTCRGRGLEAKRRQVKVRIPAGVRDGQRIRLKGRGGSGRNGGPAGDLYVITRVAPDPLFGREGVNLTLHVPVTFSEAALGAKVKVPTLDGPPVTLKLPAGTSSGRVFRVKGKGVSTAKATGDLLVTVEVAVPQKLSKEQRQAAEALAAVFTESPRSHLGV